MATWKSQPHMLGIRMVFNRGRSKLTGWRTAPRTGFGMPPNATMFRSWPCAHAVWKLGEIAERHPGLRLIIDHMGLSSALRGKPLDAAVDTRDQTCALEKCRRKSLRSALLC